MLSSAEIELINYQITGAEYEIPTTASNFNSFRWSDSFQYGRQDFTKIRAIQSVTIMGFIGLIQI